MDFILIGGAPLSQTTHDFIRVCLGAIVVQGTINCLIHLGMFVYILICSQDTAAPSPPVPELSWKTLT